MSVDTQVLLSVAFGLVIAAILFRKLVWSTAKLAGRTLVGGAVLALLAKISGVTGLCLGVNALNALVLGVLGVPGFGLLCALYYLTG